MSARLARLLLRLFGWRVVFNGVPQPRGVLIIYPHTSNWDFIIGLLAKWSIALPVRWIGKESLFRGFTGATLGRLMRHWGGRPVDRHHPSGAVGQLAALVRGEPWCWLGLSPEGTRKHTDHWRSGFYHLARELNVPVGLAFIDYRSKKIGVERFERMSGDVERDLAMLREHYAPVVGRHPLQAGTIRFASEVPSPQPACRAREDRA